MVRVSTDSMNNDMQFWLRRTERDLATTETSIARQQRIDKLRDDPLGAARAVRYESSLGRLERYGKNAATAGDGYRISEGYLLHSIDVVQRLRELAVQGATGTFSKEDRKYMAVEVDQLLQELVATANARGPDGTFLFAGAKSRTEPFAAIAGTAPGAGVAVTVDVRYLGAEGGPRAEIAEDSTMPLLQPGSEVFWAERQLAFSGYDARDWRAREDQAVVVDGRTIDIKAGDTVQAVAAKINDSGAAVKASIDPRSFSLSVESTLPHRMRLEDLPATGADGGKLPGVFRELGLITAEGFPGSNWAPAARVSGGSLFDVAIRLRDALNADDGFEIGGSAMAGLDAAVLNLTRRAAELGSRTERLDMVAERLGSEIVDTTRLLAAETDLDLAKAATDYRMLEYARNASLQFSGKLFPQTLLDFLQ